MVEVYLCKIGQKDATQVSNLIVVKWKKAQEKGTDCFVVGWFVLF